MSDLLISDLACFGGLPLTEDAECTEEYTIRNNNLQLPIAHGANECKSYRTYCRLLIPIDYC